MLHNKVRRVEVDHAPKSMTSLEIDNAARDSSGVARTPSMLGHSKGTLAIRLYELLHKVQKNLGGWGMLDRF